MGTGLGSRLSKGEATRRLARTLIHPSLEQSYWDSSHLRKIPPYFTQFSVLLTVGSPSIRVFSLRFLLKYPSMES